MTYAERIYIPTLVADMSEPIPLAHAVYWKRGEDLSKDERAGIAQLVAAGFSPHVLPEDDSAPANIDLLIGSDLYEMKNVVSDSSVSNQIKRARVKWYKLGFGTPANFVFTTEGATAGFNEIVDSVYRRMRKGEKAIVLSPHGDFEFLEK